MNARVKEVLFLHSPLGVEYTFDSPDRHNIVNLLVGELGKKAQSKLCNRPKSPDLRLPLGDTVAAQSAHFSWAGLAALKKQCYFDERDNIKRGDGTANFAQLRDSASIGAIPLASRSLDPCSLRVPQRDAKPTQSSQA